MPPDHVPFYDLAALHAEIRPEIDAAIARVLARGWYILGEEVERFEEAFARLAGARHCVTVGNGLEALTLTLRALGVGEGDEVIVPGATFIATWLAVSAVGAIPIAVDVDEQTLAIDPALVEAAITSRTRAIIPVHLYGHPCDMAAINAIAARYALAVLEDAAQAHGAAFGGRPCGSLGTAAAWSFYPAKNLGALGDGGAVTTTDDKLAASLRSLRNYGSAAKYVHERQGSNSRLDELQAAILSAKLPHLARWNAARARVALRYNEALASSDLVLPRAVGDVRPAWHLYVVRSEGRDRLRDRLAKLGIECHVHYPIPPHQQDAYAGTSLAVATLPITERWSTTALSLPLSPTMSTSDVDRVVEAVLATLGEVAHA